MKEIKNIAFDFGGVVVALSLQGAIKAFEKIGVKDASQRLDAFHQTGVFEDLESGRITMEEFRVAMCQLTGKEVSMQDCYEAWHGYVDFVPQQNLDTILQLRQKGYQVCLLSNTNPFMMKWADSPEFDGQGHPVSHYFDRLYLSYQCGIMKPAPKIFQMMLEGQNALPEETLFIDDSETNVKIAQSLGIHTLCPHDNEDWTVLIGIIFCAGHLPLRRMKRQRTQIIRRTSIGTHHHMSHWCLIRQHPEILCEISLWREILRHLKRLVRHLHRQHSVKSIRGDMMTCKHQQIPTLLAESQGIRFNRLLIRFPVETLIPHHHPAVQLHRLNQHRQVILPRRHILKDNPILHSHAVRENRTDGERRKQPTLDRVILQHLRIGDVILIAIRLIALDDQSHDIQDGIAMTVERRALQRIPIRHLILDPLLVEFLEGHAPVSPYGGDQPHVLLKNLRLLHGLFIFHLQLQRYKK